MIGGRCKIRKDCRNFVRVHGTNKGFWTFGSKVYFDKIQPSRTNRSKEDFKINKFNFSSPFRE